MENEVEVVNNNAQGGPVEEAPYYESRVITFTDLYESCSMDVATEFFDDIKLRDFFGCERAEFTTDGLVSYRDALIGFGYKEYPCPWLHGKMCFPVKERFADACPA